MKKLVICGDSFSRGIGCRDLETEPYGSLLAKHLGLELVNLAKGSSTHLNIFLQAKYAVEQYNDDIGLMCISTTSYDRIDWFPLDYQHYGELSLTDVNYHQYPPYGEQSYICGMLPNPMENDSNYRGKMLTENLVGILQYWEDHRSKNDNSMTTYFARINNEPKERIKVLYDYARMIHDPSINKVHSMGLLTMAHNLCVKKSINHLILTHEVRNYSEYMHSDNLVNVNWGKLSVDYPDDLPTSHTSKEGHNIVFDSVLKKIKTNNWDFVQPK